MPHPRRRIQSVVATVLGLRMEVVVVYRGRVRAPREARVVFWEGVRSGLGWQEAAVAAGFPRGGALWFRAAGGVKGNGAGPVSGRYLSLAEREEIAVGLAAGDGVRVIAARLGRAPSTVSREGRRNCLARGRDRAAAAQRRGGGAGGGRGGGGARRGAGGGRVGGGKGAERGVAGAGQQAAGGGVPGPAGDAGEPRDDLPVAVRAGPGGAAAGAGGEPADRAGAAQAPPEGRRAAREDRGHGEHQRAAGRGGGPGGARALGG